MDMKRFRRQLSSPKHTDDENENVPRFTERRGGGLNLVKLIGILVVCLVILPLLVGVYRDATPVDRFRGFAEARVFDQKLEQGSEYGSSQIVGGHKNELMNGLLVSGFDKRSCLSRYESILYRKESPYKPSTYLFSRLRSYGTLHKRCGPYTESYNKTLEKLKSGKNIGSTECNYMVWISFSGLGNRILTLASAFLYALLTNRVLLVDRGTDMADLFCEPFPEMSWLLPLDFPLKKFSNFDQKSPQCYGKMVKTNIINNSTTSLPPFMYLHLVHDYDDHDKLFFCDQDQSLLKRVPWLIMKTDNYFVPSLFLIPSFEGELSNLFPEKDTVFHHLGRYLFHPSNQVWGLISRYYQAYLANADERIGIQIRIFDTGDGPFQYVVDQIISCSFKEKLLPEINLKGEPIVSSTKNQTLKAVLITSLTSGYFEKFRNMYWEHPTVTGEVIGFYQPSHEEFQQTEKKMHNRKAWAEIYLLSLTDKLVTSSWSTFGYVAQGIGGLKPWILYKPLNRTSPNPPCRRAMSMEPCFHAPPFYDCKAKKGIDTGELVPHVRHCEDMSWGLKLVNHDEM